MRSSFCGAVLALVLAPACPAGESTVPRYIEFRDGSIVKLPVVDEECKITILRTNGRIEETKVRISSLQSVTLTAEQGFEKKRALLAAVQALSSDEFRDREEGTATLLKMGPAIRPDLETCLQFTTDGEALARLKHILGGFPEAAVTPRGSRIFDLLVLKELCWGHLGDEGIPVLVDGVKHRLPRKDVQAMTVTSPLPTGPGTATAFSGFRRIGAGDFPPGCIEEAFEKAADGRPLRVGENIEKLFVNKGFALSTSIASSHVSVNSFQVVGKSRGMSAANHQPLWEGEITIRFCQPGRENIAAGVTHFGCWIAAVLPNGTSLSAHDLQGRQLGTIKTQSNGHEFLAVTSAIPMHRIRIVPDIKLDRDYTLDDFIFTVPSSAEASHPEKYAVHLEGGDRIMCADVAFSKGVVQLSGLPGGLPDRGVPVARLQRINTPDQGRQKDAPAAGVFAELRDGSVLLGSWPQDKRGPPLFLRAPELLKKRDNLAGLWSSDVPRPPLAAKAPALWDGKRWLEVSSVRFLEEVVMWKDGDGFQSSSYAKLGPLWLSPPRDGPTPGSWHVRTRQGDDLVVSNPEVFDGRLSREFVATWQEQPLRLPAGAVVSIFQVPKAP